MKLRGIISALTTVIFVVLLDYSKQFNHLNICILFVPKISNAASN